MSKPLNLLHKTFNRLTIIERLPNDKSGKSMWLCQCTCGNTTTAQGSHIKRGDIQSCGCLFEEKRSEELQSRKDKAATTLICKHCKEPFTLPKSHTKTRKYCSKECYNADIYTGITLAENRAMRQTKEYRDWRKEVFKADNYTCNKCGQRGGSLAAHHLNSFTTHKELRFDLNNGVTLCKECHNNFHSIYGKIGFTEEDYYKWL